MPGFQGFRVDCLAGPFLSRRCMRCCLESISHMSTVPGHLSFYTDHSHTSMILRKCIPEGIKAR